MKGSERYNDYEGYGYQFKYNGKFYDTTAEDNLKRKLTSIVALDAQIVPLSNFNVQYQNHNVLRELNKAYSGFFDPFQQDNKHNIDDLISTGRFLFFIYFFLFIVFIFFIFFYFSLFIFIFFYLFFIYFLFFLFFFIFLFL